VSNPGWVQRGQPDAASLNLLLEALTDLLGVQSAPKQAPGGAEAKSFLLLPTPVVAQLLNSEASGAAAIARHPAGNDYHSQLKSTLVSECGLIGLLAEPAILFANNNAAKAFRHHLLSEKRVLAVVGLPTRLLRTSSIGLCLLLLVPVGAAQEVTLIDAAADGADFVAMEANGRSRKLKSLERLADVILTGSADWWVRNLPATDPALADNLDPRRHLKSPLEQEVADYFSAQGELRLGDVLEVVSTLPAAGANVGSIVVGAVYAADLPRFGLLAGVPRKREVSAAVALRRAQAFLRPGDLLVSYSRAVGFRMAIVPEDAPAPGAGGWLAAGSLWAYRARAGSHLDTRVIAMLLASPLGQHLLQSMFAGREHLTARILLELCLPQVDEPRSSEALALFLGHAQCASEILALQERQLALHHQLWPLGGDEPGQTKTP